MPSVRLVVHHADPDQPCAYLDPGGRRRVHPLLRLATTVHVVPPPGVAAAVQSADGLVDTGAWITLVRPDAWPAFADAGLVEFLPLPSGRSTYTTAVGGVGSECRLGRVWLKVVGPPRAGTGGGKSVVALPAVPVLCQLLTNPALNSRARMPREFVLGLHGGVLDGNRLVREPIPPTPAARAADAGPAHGQDWFLETAP